MVKTTIDIDDELWEEFSIRVIKDRGYRSKTEVIEELIRAYVESCPSCKVKGQLIVGIRGLDR